MKFLLKKSNIVRLEITPDSLYTALFDETTSEFYIDKVGIAVLSNIMQMDNTIFAITKEESDYMLSLPHSGLGRINVTNYIRILSNIPSKYYSVIFKIRKNWDVLTFSFCFVEKNAIDCLLRNLFLDEVLISL